MQLYKETNQYRSLISDPFSLQVVTILSFIFYSPAYYGDHVFPPWAQGVGWAMASASVVVVPLFSIYAMLFQAEGDFMTVKAQFLIV